MGSEFPLKAYGAKTTCVQCGYTIQAGIERWHHNGWAQAICHNCHENEKE